MSKLVSRIERLERANGLDTDRAAQIEADAETFMAMMGALAERCAASDIRSSPKDFGNAIRRTGGVELMAMFEVEALA